MKNKSKEAVGLGIRTLLRDIGDDMKRPSNLASTEVESMNSVNHIPLDQIEINPYQPRTEFDLVALQELCNSIKVHGIIQPLTVRKLAPKKYQLIAGERRMRASKLAGLTEVPAYVRAANDQEMLEIALIENIQREDLNAIEVAITYKRLIDECTLTHDNLSERLGKDRSTITNFLRLLKLPPEIQAAIKVKTISMGHARALAGVDNPLLQLEVFKLVITNNLSVRKTEELCRSSDTKKTSKQPTTSTSTPTNDIKRITQNLTNHLSTKVAITIRKEDRGEINIQFFSKDDLERLVELIEGV